MKVAMIGLRGIPAKSGGIETAIDNLAPLLVKYGVDVTIYCRASYNKKQPNTYKGVKLKYLPTINTKYTEAFVHSFLSTMYACFGDYDIIHYHAMGNAFFTFISRIFGKKTIVTIHGLDWKREKWGTVAKAYLKVCEKISTIFPNKVIAVSKKIKEYYKNKYGKDVLYVSNGVILEEPLELSRLKRFGITKKGYILFIGRIVPEKGLDYLIPAFKSIKTDLKLLIVGDATHTEKYLEHLKLMTKDDSRILFTGPLYEKEKIEAYSNAKFLVLPSTIEGMPLVLLEAMSFGLCPLVSDIEENIEVIGVYGLKFKSKNVDDLKEKISYMIKNNKKISRLANKSKKYILKMYDWDKIAKKTIRIYKGII